MKIIVIGATGTIGTAIADVLASRHEVVRAPRRGQPPVDIDDAASVTALFEQIEDVDGVVVCAPSVRTAMIARAPLAELTHARLDVAVQRLMPRSGCWAAMLKVRMDQGDDGTGRPRLCAGHAREALAGFWTMSAAG
jgi:hypothetical protein